MFRKEKAISILNDPQQFLISIVIEEGEAACEPADHRLWHSAVVPS